MAVRIAIAEPRRVLREAMAEALELDFGATVVARTDDVASTALQSRRTGPEVVLVSPAFNGTLANICGELQALEPRPRTLFFDAPHDDRALLAAIEAGVDGYLTANSGLQDVFEAIQALARGESVIPPTMLGALLRGLISRRRELSEAAAKLEKLTKREGEVLRLLVQGLDQSQIADQLFISPQTARTHVQRILSKLEVHSRLEAIAFVARTDSADPLERMVEGSVL
jgi:DNA-binding NarL/FixJ family response regulator